MLAEASSRMFQESVDEVAVGRVRRMAEEKGPQDRPRHWENSFFARTKTQASYSRKNASGLGRANCSIHPNDIVLSVGHSRSPFSPLKRGTVPFLFCKPMTKGKKQRPSCATAVAEHVRLLPATITAASQEEDSYNQDLIICFITLYLFHCNIIIVVSSDQENQ